MSEPALIKNLNPILCAKSIPMKAYTSTTGIIFGLITLAHVFRIILENHALAKDPIYGLLTVLTTALSIWAWRLVRTRATTPESRRQI